MSRPEKVARDKFGRFITASRLHSSLVGRKFGRLRVIRFAGRLKGSRLWKLRCDCGKVTFGTTNGLRRGDKKSCGCLNQNLRSARCLLRTRHGHKRRSGQSATYRSWCAMKTRCLNAKQKLWHRYGGRGIRVSRRWMIFENFLADMGLRPAGTTLGRFMDAGDYRKGNCAWMTRVQQVAEAKKAKAAA